MHFRFPNAKSIDTQGVVINTDTKEGISTHCCTTRLQGKSLTPRVSANAVTEELQGDSAECNKAAAAEFRFSWTAQRDHNLRFHSFPAPTWKSFLLNELNWNWRGTFTLYFGSELASAICFILLRSHRVFAVSWSLSSARAAHLTDKTWFIDCKSFTLMSWRWDRRTKMGRLVNKKCCWSQII